MSGLLGAVGDLLSSIHLSANVDPGIQAQLDIGGHQILDVQLLVCFAHGTNVLTERGEVLVEDLKVGDMVVTPHGTAATMPIRWIGRQHFEGVAALTAQPVVIKAGALGNGLPHREMRVSGDHCLFLDGHLVPVKLLVNGETIVADAGHAVMNYVNIEFDCHTVVLAEGVACETYLDCGNRACFDNAGEACEWLASRPARDNSAWTDGTAFAAPLWNGPKLDALRARLGAHDAQNLAVAA